MNSQSLIGIIDSGVGGLTVAKEIIRQLPRESIVYFGDSARCPYGSRPPEEIRAFTFQVIRFVTRFPLKALVIACNTATAVVLEEVIAQLPLPVLGVVEPGARAAITASRTGRIGILGTEATIRAGAYERALHRIHPQLYTVSLACPQFVPLVEGGSADTEEARRMVADTLRPLRYEELDTVILGCTHYPLLAPRIQEVLGDGVTLISSAEETARELSALLSLAGLHAESTLSGESCHRFFTSGDPDLFRRIGEKWLDREIHVEHISLTSPNLL